MLASTGSTNARVRGIGIYCHSVEGVIRNLFGLVDEKKNLWAVFLLLEVGIERTVRSPLYRKWWQRGGDGK